MGTIYGPAKAGFLTMWADWRKGRKRQASFLILQMTPSVSDFNLLGLYYASARKAFQEYFQYISTRGVSARKDFQEPLKGLQVVLVPGI